MVDEQIHNHLIHMIATSIPPDRYLDIQEELFLLEYAERRGVIKAEMNALILQECDMNGWIIERVVLAEMTRMLQVGAEDDSIVDELEFNHVVNFAVKNGVPRSTAEQHCIKVILELGWRAYVSRPFGRKWFTKKRDHYKLL